jgi:hypothetical protein
MKKMVLPKAVKAFNAEGGRAANWKAAPQGYAVKTLDLGKARFLQKQCFHH